MCQCHINQSTKFLSQDSQCWDNLTMLLASSMRLKRDREDHKNFKKKKEHKKKNPNNKTHREINK
jgi:hypothetical protein